MGSEYYESVDKEIKLVSDEIFELSDNIKILKSQYESTKDQDILTLIKTYLYEGYFNFYKDLIDLHKLTVISMGENKYPLGSFEKTILDTSNLLVNFDDYFP